IQGNLLLHATRYIPRSGSQEISGRSSRETGRDVPANFAARASKAQENCRVGQTRLVRLFCVGLRQAVMTRAARRFFLFTTQRNDFARTKKTETQGRPAILRFSFNHPNKPIEGDNSITQPDRRRKPRPRPTESCSHPVGPSHPLLRR